MTKHLWQKLSKRGPCAGCLDRTKQGHRLNGDFSITPTYEVQAAVLFLLPVSLMAELLVLLMSRAECLGSLGESMSIRLQDLGSTLRILRLICLIQTQPAWKLAPATRFGIRSVSKYPLNLRDICPVDVNDISTIDITG